MNKKQKKTLCCALLVLSQVVVIILLALAISGAFIPDTPTSNPSGKPVDPLADFIKAFDDAVKSKEYKHLYITKRIGPKEKGDTKTALKELNVYGSKYHLRTPTEVADGISNKNIPEIDNCMHEVKDPVYTEGEDAVLQRLNAFLKNVKPKVEPLTHLGNPTEEYRTDVEGSPEGDVLTYIQAPQEEK